MPQRLEAPRSGRLRCTIQLALPFVLVLVLVLVSDVEKMLELLGSSQPPSLLAGYLVFEVAILLRTWRWVAITRRLGVSPGTPGPLATFRIGWFAGAFLPQGWGPFIKVLYMRDPCRSTAVAVACVVLERLLDLVSMLVFGAAGAVYLLCGPHTFTLRLHLGSTGRVAVVLGLGLGLLLLVVLLPGVRRSLVAIAAPLRRSRQWRSVGEALALCRTRLDGSTLSVLMAGSSVIWVAHLLATLCLLHGLSAGISFAWAAAAFALASLALVLPLSIDGVGVREASLLALFVAASQPGEAAIVWGALISLMSLLSRALGAPLLLRYPLPV